MASFDDSTNASWEDYRYSGMVRCGTCGTLSCGFAGHDPTTTWRLEFEGCFNQYLMAI